MADLVATFRKPFPEQVAAWRLRLRELRPTYGSADLAYSGHDRAFMVAGAVKADLLADLSAAVDRAVVEGTGFDAFKKDFRAIVERRGWHGWTGEGSLKGEEWRMRTIYRTNMRASYMAGRHAQLVAGGYRWWVYRHSGAAHPRLNHLAWDGIALPPDHPFWQTHYPPNGWGCGCEAEGARTEAGIRRMGGDPDKRLPDGWQSIDPRTGTLPGIGKGWGHSPSFETTNMIRTMAEKAVDWHYNSAIGFMRELPEAVRDDFATGYRATPSLADALRRAFNRVQDHPEQAAATRQTLGLATQQRALEIEELTGFKADLIDFVIEGDRLRHIQMGHSDPLIEANRNQTPVTAADIMAIPALIDEGRIVGVDRTNRGGQPGLKFIYSVGGRTLHAVFELHPRRRRLVLHTLWVMSSRQSPT